MRKLFLCVLLFVNFNIYAFSEGREYIPLNGTWAFDQTETSFPPKKFTRTIPVPGLITLAEPKISQFDSLYAHYMELDKIPYCKYEQRGYIPMYNWYSRKFTLDSNLKGKYFQINILKSMYVTTIYINGHMVANSMKCSTPIVAEITKHLYFDKENEILIMVGDRVFLPSAAAGGTDVEKFQYIPGIWDDVFLTATGEIAVDKALFLPSLKNGKVTVKTLLRDFNPSEGILWDNRCLTEFSMTVRIREKKSGNVVATKTIDNLKIETDKLEQFNTEIEVPNAHAWSPEDPFLYVGEIDINCYGKTVDTYSDQFGIRDFKVDGRYFSLNDKRYLLRGSNITLHRFFEDPQCKGLPWNREWVKKLLIDNPKAIDWNAMRICVGLVPDFWYDLCDEYGLVLQNEWMYWQKRGWNEQIRKEYTDWVWSDGNHPSIVIWDAINENVDNFIGYKLIPELKELDPTRVWDAGYMEDGGQDDMDEPHTYVHVNPWNKLDTDEKLNAYFDNVMDKFGSFDYWKMYPKYYYADVPQLTNEYGWSWLNRDGGYTILSKYNYRFYVGENATPDQRREFQAYWLQTETEWLRSKRNLAGILCFCTLTNNYGRTGDWYINNIKDLEPSPAYKWFKHCFAPSAVFIDLSDSRYTKHVPVLTPGEELAVNFVGVNDYPEDSKGIVNINIYNSAGSKVYTVEKSIVIPGYGSLDIPTILNIPSVPGGYTITAEYTQEGGTNTYVSRRFVKVGNTENYSYYEIQP